MAIIGNYTQEKHDFLLQSEFLRTQAFRGGDIPANATLEQTRAFFTGENVTIAISSLNPSQDELDWFDWVTGVTGDQYGDNFRLGLSPETPSSLEGFRNLASVEGNFNISYIGGSSQTSNTVSLSGFRNLISIGTRLIINLSSAPPDYIRVESGEGFSKLSSIGGGLEIYGDGLIPQDLTFDALTSVSNNIEIDSENINNINFPILTSINHQTSSSSRMHLKAAESINMPLFVGSSNGRGSLQLFSPVLNLPLFSGSVDFATLGGHAYGDAYSTAGLTSMTGYIGNVTIYPNCTDLSVLNILNVRSFSCHSVLDNLSYFNVGINETRSNNIQDFNTLAIDQEAIDEDPIGYIQCALNPNGFSGLRTRLEQTQNFAVSVWDGTYPNGRTDCTSIEPEVPITPPDIHPNPFSFTDATNQQPNVVIESDVVTINGFTGTLPVQLVGGINAEISLNGEAFTSNVSVTAGDTIQLRATTPDALGLTTGIFVLIGGISAVWTIATSANVGPMITNPLQDRMVQVEDTFDLDISNVFTDPEHPNLTYQLLGGPPSLKIADDHIVGTLTLNDLGTWNAVLQATDDEGAKGIDNFTIEVDINRDDIKELITEVEDLNMQEEETETELQALRSKLDMLCDTVEADTEKLNRLETVVAQNTLALLDIPLDGEDMVYWLTKFTQQENALYQLIPSDYPLFIDKRSISVDPATGNSIAEGRALVNGVPEDGIRIVLSNSPRLGPGFLMETTTTNSGFYSFDFTSLPNTTYYVSASHGANFYQVAIAYQGTSS